MSKPQTPQYPTVQAAQVPTGSDLYNQGLNFINQNGLGYTLSAQGQAVQNANNPAYYSSFQPSSFQQALANQSFQNIWPQEQAAIAQQQSNSGQAYSPGASAAQGLAYGNLATGIGEYLNQQGMQEANTGIQAGLSINPNEVLSPYVQTGANQGNMQAQLNQQANLTNASGSYANQLANYNQQMAFNTGGLSLLGAGAGAVAAPSIGMTPMAGASLGAGFGGALAGSQNSMFPYMMASQYFNQLPGMNTPGQTGGYSLSNSSPSTGYGAALSPYSAPNVSGTQNLW